VAANEIATLFAALVPNPILQQLEQESSIVLNNASTMYDDVDTGQA
jgi:TPP-dependent trihydroxycyclohexane-1,2-dione (THcHDO) dehydratase